MLALFLFFAVCIATAIYATGRGAHFLARGEFFPLRSDLSFRSEGSARSELLRNSSLRSYASSACVFYLHAKKREEGTAHSVSQIPVRFSSRKPCNREPMQRMPAPQADLCEGRFSDMGVGVPAVGMPAPQADLCEVGIGFLSSHIPYSVELALRAKTLPRRQFGCLRRSPELRTGWGTALRPTRR